MRPKFDRYLSLASRARTLADFRETILIVAITEQVQECRDAKDDKFLELAAGKADLILTGDQDLLMLHPWRGISIQTPASYLIR